MGLTIKAAREPFCGSSAHLRQSNTKQATRQERLHISPTVGDHINVDLLPHDTVDHLIGLEGGLPIIPNAEGQQFLGVDATLRCYCTTLDISP